MSTQALPARADAVLSYWFGADYAQPQPPGYWAAEEQSKVWFRGGLEVDQHIKDNFGEDISNLAAGSYDDWMHQPLAALAGIVLADQFTRNVHRGTAQSFALDNKALQWSQHVRTAWDVKSALPSPPLRYFSYMPLMHSEDLQDQELLVQLVKDELAALSQQDLDSAAAKSWADILRFAEAHRDVVKRWGRFPHRNAVLGRQSTHEEEAGLQDGSIPRW